MQQEKNKKNKENLIYNHTNRELLDTSLVISAEETAQKNANGDAM
jgi:glutamyl-tRNA synthetase